MLKIEQDYLMPASRDCGCVLEAFFSMRKMTGGHESLENKSCILYLGFPARGSGEKRSACANTSTVSTDHLHDSDVLCKYLCYFL